MLLTQAEAILAYSYVSIILIAVVTVLQAVAVGLLLTEEAASWLRPAEEQ